jgi:uncharacterized repeat protein (TIGR01451 family)
MAAAAQADRAARDRGDSTNDAIGARAETRGSLASPASSSTISARADADRPVVGMDSTVRSSLAYPTGSRSSSVILLETDGPREVRVGDTFSYAVRVSNLTDAPVHGVVVYDVESTEGAIRGSGHAVVASSVESAKERVASDTPIPATTRASRTPFTAWDVGVLAPHETKSRQVSGQSDVVGPLKTCLAVSYVPTLCTSISVVKPELRLSKEVPSEVMVCQDITYRYVVSNVGTGTATSVKIEDPLAEGLTTTRGEKIVKLDIGDLRAGETKQQSVTLRAAHVGTFASTATASSGDVRGQSRDLPTSVREPVLAVSVQGPESRYLEETIDYRITVRNTGDAPAQRAMLHLTTNGSVSSGLGDRDLGTIEPGTSKSIPISVTATLPQGNERRLMLTATADARCARPASGSASVAVLTVPALLLECNDSTDPVRVGKSTVYTITVTNQGTGADSNVLIKVLVPPEEQYVDGSGATRVHADGQSLLFEPVETLAPKQTAQWRVEVRGVKAGDARFNVELTSNSLTRPATKSESTRVVDEGVAAPASQELKDVEREEGSK